MWRLSFANAINIVFFIVTFLISSVQLSKYSNAQLRIVSDMWMLRTAGDGEKNKTVLSFVVVKLYTGALNQKEETNK